jgi:ornithine carbamoyltransferase
MSPRHLISWENWKDEEILSLLDFALYVKSNRVYFSGHMQGRSLVMLFQKTSTRTRVSFEAGMTELGGHAIFLDWMSSNFQLSDIELEAEYLSRNVSVIMARMKKHEDLLLLKKGSHVPVINGCCNLYHPCQSLADMLTIAIDSGGSKNIKGKKLVYVGVHNNVANSLVEITSALGVHLTLVTPIAEKESISEQAVARAKKNLTISWEKDLKIAIKDADYVYTDTWVDMEYFNDPSYSQKKEDRIKTMMPFQLNETLMKGSKAKIMHDMPIHPGYEITKELVQSNQSIVFSQAENRLDAQKAIIMRLLDLKA